MYRIIGTNKYVSYNLKNQYETQPIHVNVNIVNNDVLDIEAFRNWMPEYRDAEFVLEDGNTFVAGQLKMSKSMFNVVNPDDIVENTVPIRCVCTKFFFDRWNNPNLGTPMALTVYIVS